VVAREAELRIDGSEEDLRRAVEFFELLRDAKVRGLSLRTGDVRRMLESWMRGAGEELREFVRQPFVVSTPRRSIAAKTPGQRRYLEAIRDNTIVFGTGPAGTGKTYLAVAAAVAALVRGDVQRIVLARPAVEAGEALGFLPGDLREKLLPYLRPLQDALQDMLDRDVVERFIDKGVIEIAPLAYMRGRTLAQAFVILDEAQNTTPEQMLLLLTRLGEEGRIVVTGDPSQVDLPRHKVSGLEHACRLLGQVPGIAVCRLDAGDTVRHPLVRRIIQAYAAES
jgi:phosphate starvation-inducible PhoH-like protein